MESSGVSPHFLEHLDWVRDLARSLVRDASQADDLSQEAWLAARARPAGVSLRRWLGGVVRNLALETRRGEGRRRDREALATARESAQHATAADLVLERAAVQRRVVEHVMELEEPYRTAILLRYFDGSKPHEIARRLGVPAATVKTRLRRAHELLRARLSRDEPDGAWLGSLLLLVVPRTENAAAFGAGAMGGIALSTKIAAVSLAGLCALGGWWALSDPTPDAPVTVAGAPESAAPSASIPAALDGSGTTRSEHREPAIEASEPDVTVTAAATVAEERRLEATAIDVEGVPVAGLELRFLSDGYEDLRGITDGRGVLSLAHPSRNGRLVASSDVYVTLLESHVHATGANETLVVVVAPSCELAGEVVDERGSPVANAVLHFGVYSNLRDQFTQILDGSAFGEWKTETDASGQFSLPRVPCLDASFLRVRRAGFTAQSVELAGRSDARMRIVLDTIENAASVLLGRVVDAHGTPVEGARVALGRTGASTNERGEFQLDVKAHRAPPDDVHHHSTDADHRPDEPTHSDWIEGEVLSALAPGFLPARLARDLAAHPEGGWPDFTELVVEGVPLAIRGSIVDAEGVPVQGAKVGIADRTYFGVIVDHRADASIGRLAFVEDFLGGLGGDNGVVADATGRFEIRGLEPRDYRLWVVGPTMATTVSEPIAAASDGVEIELPESRSIAVRGRVVRPGGQPMAGVRVTPMRELEPGSVPPGVRGPLVYSSTSVETGADGRFAFDALTVDDVELLVWAGPDYSSPQCSLAGYGSEDELEIVVAASCHFYVELAEGIDGDTYWMEDEEGKRLDLVQRSGEFRFGVSEAKMFGSRSGVYAVDETARTLVVVANGIEVLRVPIELEVGATTPLCF